MSIQVLAQILALSKNPVFFGGAGVSTESGIPDFRSVDGLYNEEYKYPPEQIISHSFWEVNPSEFYRFYRNKMLFPEAQPNAAHNFLAKNGIPVVTQNIDGLHQKAGSTDVFELHGSVWRNFCTRAKHPIDFSQMVKLIDDAPNFIPLCPLCAEENSQSGTLKSIVKPDVVLYEEPLDSKVWSKAEAVVRNADTLIVGGTSLVVYPAASILHYFRGGNLIVINKSHLDITTSSRANLIQISAPIGEVFAAL